MHFLFILINKKSVVYLKPKGPDGNSNSNDGNASAEKQSDSSTTQTNNNESVGAPVNTSANLDESVISSELKALRQSSIAMSASQKEGATQIIKDWIDDGSPQDNADETAEGEE